jgi:hypothetical protein
MSCHVRAWRVHGAMRSCGEAAGLLDERQQLLEPRVLDEARVRHGGLARPDKLGEDEVLDVRQRLGRGAAARHYGVLRRREGGIHGEAAPVQGEAQTYEQQNCRESASPGFEPSLWHTRASPRS